MPAPQPTDDERAELDRLLRNHPRYRRSNGYDPEWVAANQMGPHALWLLEALTEVLDLERGMKILDLGCGKAMTSIFLARELGAEVWATDLWIPAGDNQRRIVEAGVADLVHPLHAEAHALPYATDFFDAIVSIDAYQYFGTDDLYLGYLLDFCRTGGQLGIVVPSLSSEIGRHVPPHLQPFWQWEFCCFHSPEWWETHWAKTAMVEIDHADNIADAWQDWSDFEGACRPFLNGWRRDDAADTVDMLAADQGRYLGFARVVATKSPPKPTR